MPLLDHNDGPIYREKPLRVVGVPWEQLIFFLSHG